jgi:hypothetical protein
MKRFEANFECNSREEAIGALIEVIERMERGFECGNFTDSEVDGDWGMSGEEEDEEDEEIAREVYVKWDVSDSEFETFVNEGVPRRVWIPANVEEENIADWISNEYGYCVESWYFIDEI